MESLDISWYTIFKIFGAGVFTYLVLPILLILRDLLIHKVIDKWIVTEKLYSMINICESDRWLINNEFNGNRKLVIARNKQTYKLDDIEVCKEIYDDYVEKNDIYRKRFHELDSKIAMRHNLIVWLTKHYKLAECENSISKLRKDRYKSIDRKERNKAN